MAGEVKNKKSRIQQLIRQLFASSDREVISALEELKEIGDESVVKPLLELYGTTDNEEIKSATMHFLFSLKPEKAIEPLMEALRSEHLRSHRGFIISVFWNSGLQPTDHIGELVRIAIDSNYMEILEVLTVIENMDGPFNDEVLTDAIFDLREATEDMKDGHKKDLLSSLEEVLVNFENRQ